MLVYYIGVLLELVKAGAYKPGKTQTAGSHGGAIIALLSTTGVHQELTDDRMIDK